MTVRSLTIFCDRIHPASATWTDLYEVPSGKTLIVKDFRVLLSVTNTTRAIIAADADSGGEHISVWDVANPVLDQPLFDRGCFIVLGPGKHLRVYTTSSTYFYILISGALLDGTV